MLNALVESGKALIVPKEKIAANGDYNLSGERYREGAVAMSSYPFVPLSEVARVKNGFAFKSEEYVDKGLRVMRIKNVQKGEVIDDDPKFMATERRKEFADYTLKAGDILMSLTGNVGRVGQLKQEHQPAVLNQRVAHVEPINGAPCLSEYLFAILNTGKFEADAIAGSSGVAQANLSSKWVGDYQIPLPPLEMQKEIVAEIEGYQKVINGARAVLDHYRPHIPIHPDWPMVLLGDIFKLSSGRGLTQTNMKEGRYPVYGGNGKTGTHSEYFLETENIVIGRVGAYCGAVHITEPKAWITDNGLYISEFKKEINLGYLAQVLAQLNLNQFAKVGGQPSISQTTVCERTIPLPPLATQQAIVAEIEAEQALVAANRELIARFEQKIQATLARVWGENTHEPLGETA